MYTIIYTISLKSFYFMKFKISFIQNCVVRCSRCEIAVEEGELQQWKRVSSCYHNGKGCSRCDFIREILIKYSSREIIRSYFELWFRMKKTKSKSICLLKTIIEDIIMPKYCPNFHSHLSLFT